MSKVYKFREDELIDEFKRYIDSTYKGHYGQGGLQSSEIIVDRGHGMGFFSGNIDKYNDRYGKKGESPEDWRKDIMKTIHYGFLKLFEHDRMHGVEKQAPKQTDLFTETAEYNPDLNLSHNYSIDNASVGEWDAVRKKYYKINE